MVSRLIKRLRKMGDGPEGCVDIRGLSSEYVDEELDDSTVGRIGAHLEGCEPCQAFFRTLRATLALLRSSLGGEGSAAPEGFRDRVASRIREGGAR